jgi:hypothetical protein
MSCRVDASVRPIVPAISAWLNPNTSCRTKTARSSGVSDSSTTSMASDTDSASSARSAVSGAVVVSSGSGSHGPT